MHKLQRRNAECLFQVKRWISCWKTKYMTAEPGIRRTSPDIRSWFWIQCGNWWRSWRLPCLKLTPSWWWSPRWIGRFRESTATPAFPRTKVCTAISCGLSFPGTEKPIPVRRDSFWSSRRTGSATDAGFTRSHRPLWSRCAG